MAVEREGEPVELGGPKQRAVLALLVAHTGEAVSADRILVGVWGAEASESSRGSLQTYISNLRALLGDVISRVGDGYRLDVTRDRVDATRFEDALDEARRLLPTDAERARTRLRDALAMWRGLPYSDLSNLEGLQGEIRRLEELRLAAVELRIDADLAAGLYDNIIAEVGALAEEHPLRERFRAQHMLALYRAGRQAEALRAYQHTKENLAAELGLEPSQELQDLELAILQQDEELQRGPSRPTTQRLAFLVTDIEDSTTAWDAHPQAMAEALVLHDRILSEVIESCGGSLFKHTGDGVLAAFPDVISTVECAETVQRALTSTDWGELGEIRVRMGIDVGEAEVRGGDFYGPPVNRATRLSAAAHGGQVLVSQGAQADVAASAPAGLQIRQLGEHRLKGFAAPERISQLVFVGLPGEFPQLRVDADFSADTEPLAVSLPGYEIREQIGAGAFGIVYRAYQPSVGREVAVKVIRPDLARHPAFIHRFEAEARTVARLAHPRIVPLIDFWRDSEGAYLVLALLPGGSLQQLLAAGDVDRAVARLILRHIAEALDHAHRNDLVHGDLNPANVLLDSEHNAYLSDFSIPARILDAEIVASVSAAPEFRAPEEDVTGPSKRTDIYALGMIARKLLEDEEAEPILARATASNPEDRFPTASSFVAELDVALGDEPSAVERPPVSRNPYKGLRAFDEADAADFFGRDELVATLVSAVHRYPFVAVVGPSGSGKSSVVQAGLLPELRRGGADVSESWLPVVVTPGLRPTEALLDALDSVASEPMDLAGLMKERGLSGVIDLLLGNLPGGLVLIIDQFEELFSLVEREQRREFIAELVKAVGDKNSRSRVVVTLRADFYDRPLEHSELGRLVRDGLVTVLRPTREELIEMISRPAQAVGLRWEPGLPHRIAQEIEGQPGGLPLLQYALTEMVEHRRGDLLTSSSYQWIGGVAGALWTRAEAVFSELSNRQQEASRQILLRLVSVDEEADDTRRRVRRTELESLGIDRGDLQAVLDAFTTERLLLADRDPVTRGPTVEVAHEALLREWPRLRGWIEDQREGLILSRRLRVAIDEWDTAGRDEGYLLTGSRLAPFLAWAEHSSLSADEREFIEASKRKDSIQQEARKRRRRTLMAILGSAAIAAVFLAAWALVERGRATDEAARANTEAEQRLAAQLDAEAQAELAEQQTALAERNAALARSRELAAAAISVLDEDPTLSKLLSLAAADIADPPLESVSALHRAYAADRVVARYTWPEEYPTAFQLWTYPHPSGERLVASGADGLPLNEFQAHLEVVDIETGDVVWDWDLDHPEVAIDRPRFTEDEALVVAASLWETRTRAGPEPAPEELGLFMWDVDTGELVQRLDLGSCGGFVQALSGTHALVMSVPEGTPACWGGTSPAMLELVDLNSGERETLTTQAVHGIASLDGGGALSGDGRLAAFDDGTGLVAFVDVESGERIAELNLAGPDDLFAYVRRLDEDGSHLIYGKDPIRIVDVSTGEVVTEIDVFDSWIALHEDLLLATTREGDMKAFRMPTGLEMFTIHNTGTGNVAPITSNKVLVSDGTSGATIVDFGPRGELGAVETCSGLAASSLDTNGTVAAFIHSCEEDQLAPGLIRSTASVADTFVVDLDTAEMEYVLPDAKGNYQPISPDGTRFVRQQGDGGLLTGPLLVRDVATGEEILELDGFCWWDAIEFSRGESECVEQTQPPFAMLAQRIHWSPDGSMIAAINGTLRGEGAYLAVWDAGTGELLYTETGAGELSHHVDVIFTPDSSGLVVSYWGAALRRFNTETWELERETPFTTAITGSRGISFVGYTPDGADLITVEGLNESRSFAGSAGALLWLDSHTLETSLRRENVHDSEVTVKAINEDGSLIATGSANGVVRIWDAVSGQLVHEIPVGGDLVKGVAFIDDTRLAVTPQQGSMLIVTYDTSQLLHIARESLTRGFTPLECEKFNFGDDCPTLDELRQAG